MAHTANTLPAATRQLPKRSAAKTWLWVLLGAAVVFVFISNEVLLIVDYRLYHGYRMQLIADHRLFIPHAVFGTVALLSGPVQFSARLRQRHLQLHRVVGRVYVASVFFAAVIAITISWNRALMVATTAQAGAWIVCTAAALITARNRQIAQHRQWMVRSYAVTFTFISLRLLSVWPRYWNLSDAAGVLNIILVTFGSVLLADLGLSWRELTTKREASHASARTVG